MRTITCLLTFLIAYGSYGCVNSQDTITKAICSGGYYVNPITNQQLSQAGFYSDTLFTQTGFCDSIIVTQIIMKPGNQVLVNHNGYTCNGQPYNFRGQWYGKGTYSILLPAITSCDTTLTLRVFTGSKKLTILDTTICPGTLLFFNNRVITSDGVYFDTLTTIQGCDSIVLLGVTVRLPFGADAVVPLCSDSVRFNHKTYRQPGYYLDTFLAPMAVCDSIRTLHIVDPHQYYYNKYAVICLGGVYVYFGDTLSDFGTFLHTFTSTAGCDSLEQLTLSVTQPIRKHEIVNLCFTDFPVKLRGKTYSVPGIFEDTVRDNNGICIDSIITEEILLTNPVNYARIVVCRNSFIDYGGGSYFMGNIAATFLIPPKNSQSCQDSITSLTLIPNGTFDTYLYDITCGDYPFRDSVFQGNGVFFYSLPSNYCDTTFILSLRSFQSGDSISIILTDSTLHVRVPAGPSFSSYEWFLNGTHLATTSAPSLVANQTGNYRVVAKGINGIDSSCVLYVEKYGVQPISALTVYPNPSHGAFKIYNPFQEGLVIHLYDMLGKNVGVTVLSKGENYIDMNFSPGLYILHSNDSIKWSKLISIY
ncbi:MAG: T9SS type A sorting domain-containing protein [Chitinophagales bacterium]